MQGNEGRLEQVVLNLVMNALQAMPPRETSQNVIVVRLAPAAAGASGGAILEIADNGAGMPPDVQERLFEPFFTTKPKGAGTGLGLSICKNIVEGLGGRIEIESAVNEGTKFRLHLPAAIADPPSAEPLPRPAEDDTRLNVLLVDDEPLMGETVRRVLAEHQLTAVTSGRRALELLSSGHRFDVVLCDLMMPEMTGQQLYGELAQRFPDVAERVVFVTGGAFTPETMAFLEQAQARSVAKRFAAAALRQSVRDVARRTQIQPWRPAQPASIAEMPR